MENKIDFKRYFENKIKVNELKKIKKTLSVSSLIEFFHMEREVLGLGGIIMTYLSDEEKKYLVLRYQRALPMCQVVVVMMKSRSHLFTMDKKIREKLKDKR